MKNIKESNIFNFATKELTQDAFFCWLAIFAKPIYKDSEYSFLHELAIDFFKSILNYEKPIEELEVKTQVSKIDIWIVVNNKDLIIVEDKTFSTLGTDQLLKYYNTATSFKEKNNLETLTCIYFKFGLESEKSFTKNENHGKWSKKTLEDLVSVFRKYGDKIDHPFFRDYLELAMYRNSLTTDFSKHIIEGDKNVKNELLEAFYKKLEDDGVFHNWRFIDQRGARNYYANDYKFNGQVPAVYIQLDKLTLRLKIDLGELKDERGKTYKKFQEKLKSNDIKFIYDEVRDLFSEKITKKLTKPARISVHNFLTIANFSDSFWLQYTAEGYLDYEATKENLRKIDQLVKIKNHELFTEIKKIKDYAFSK